MVTLPLSDPDSRVDDLDILEASHPELFETPLRTGRELVEAFQSIAQQISDSFINDFDESQTKDGMMLVIAFLYLIDPNSILPPYCYFPDHFSLISFQALWLYKLSLAARAKSIEWATAATDISMAVLANSPSTRYVELLQSVYGYEDESDEEDVPTAPVPLEPGKRAAPPDDEPTVTPPKRARRGAPTLPPALQYPSRYPLDDRKVRVFYPTSSGDTQEAGIPPALFVDAHSGGTYQCRFDQLALSFKLKKSDPPCTFKTRGKASYGAHLRRVHLGHCLQCPICEDPPRRYWQARGWATHMTATHTGQEDEWYWEEDVEQPLFPPTPKKKKKSSK